MFFAHETAIIDENVTIGTGTKIWHFSHIMSNAILGERCNIGQNRSEERRVGKECSS